jgi:hypothetical protein
MYVQACTREYVHLGSMYDKQMHMIDNVCVCVSLSVSLCVCACVSVYTARAHNIVCVCVCERGGEKVQPPRLEKNGFFDGSLPWPV